MLTSLLKHCRSRQSRKAVTPLRPTAEKRGELGGRTVMSTRIRRGARCKMTVMSMKLTAVFEKVPEGYIGFVEELPGANTQGTTLEEARLNLKEAVEMVLDANRVLAEEALNGRSVIREPFVIVYL